MQVQKNALAINPSEVHDPDADNTAFADCPWFIDEWCRDHPEFPLDPRVQVEVDNQKEN